MSAVPFEFSPNALEKILTGLAFAGNAKGFVEMVHHYAQPRYRSRQDAHGAGQVAVAVLARFFVGAEFKIVADGDGMAFGFEMSMPEGEIQRQLGKAVAA